MSDIPDGYKMTEVGVIPEDWETGILQDYISFISYGFTNPMPVAENGIYMITAANINNGEILFETARCTTEFAYHNLLTAKSRPQKDDILLTKDGTLGRVALVGEELICINQSVAVIRPSEKIFPKFLKILLESPVYQQKMLEDAGGSTIKHIYITIVNLMPIAMPPTLMEQRAIADALSEVDEQITALDDLIAKQRDLKQGAMQELLTGQRRLPGFSGEWEVKKLGEIAEITMGQSPSSLNYNTEGRGLPLIQGNADVENRQTIVRIFTTEITKLFYKGDLIMTVRAPVGRISVAIFDGCLGRGVCSIRYPNHYLYHYLINHEENWGALSKGSTFDSVTSQDVRESKVYLPKDLNEQVAIAETLSNIDAELAALEEQREKTIALKQGMMQELLTGQTRLV